MGNLSIYLTVLTFLILGKEISSKYLIYDI